MLFLVLCGSLGNLYKSSLNKQSLPVEINLGGEKGLSWDTLPGIFGFSYFGLPFFFNSLNSFKLSFSTAGSKPYVSESEAKQSHFINEAGENPSYLSLYRESDKVAAGTGNGSKLTFSVNTISGFTVVINSIKIVFNNTTPATVKVGDTKIESTATEAKTGVYAINSSSFTLQNKEKDQLRISSIEITYSIVANS